MSMKEFGNRESIALMTAPLVAAGGALKGLVNFGHWVAQSVMRGYEYQGATQASMYANTPAGLAQIQAERSAIYAQPIGPLFEMGPLEQAGSDALGLISTVDLGVSLLTKAPELADSVSGLLGGLRREASVANSAVRGSVADASFAQPLIRSDRMFSEIGQRTYSSLTGTPIETVDDLVAALSRGEISPSQVPLDFVDMDGTRLILNTRTSTALRDAGIQKAD